jgi:hypothetical protein
MGHELVHCHTPSGQPSDSICKPPINGSKRVLLVSEIEKMSKERRPCVSWIYADKFGDSSFVILVNNLRLDFL